MADRKTVRQMWGALGREIEIGYEKIGKTRKREIVCTQKIKQTKGPKSSSKRGGTEKQYLIKILLLTSDR